MESAPQAPAPEAKSYLARFAIMGRDGRLTFQGEHPETVQTAIRDGRTLVNNLAPFAFVVRSGGRGNAYDVISFYRLTADRIVAHRGGNSLPLWVHSTSCPALHDLARAVEAARIPPPEVPGEDRVVCTADCTHYGLTFNGKSGEEFSIGETVDNDNVWRVFRQSINLPDCWRAQASE